MMDAQDAVLDVDINSKNDADSAGIVTETSVSEVMISETVIENGVKIGNSDNGSSSKSMVSEISSNSTPDFCEQNIVSEERNELKIINDVKMFEGTLQNVNPTPNLEDMITDDTTDCNLVNPASKDTHKESVNITTDTTESTHIEDMNSIESRDQGVIIVRESEKRNDIIVEAMEKDLQWKKDNEYQNNLSSLKLLCDYGSDSEEDNTVGGECVNVNQPVDAEVKKKSENYEVEILSSSVIQQAYRKPESEESETEEESDSSDDDDEEEGSSTSSSEASSSSSDESEDSVPSSNECVVIKEKKPKAEVPKTKGELGIEDLPPIEDLHISVPESQCVEIGEVLSIVDSLVVVQSIKGCPTLDLDSILFLDHGNNTLGQVFDVFGKVGEACYCVRFNSKDHALERGVQVGMPVYFAPQTEHSKFVFLADLMKMKGSDASWEHNNEPPAKFLDYSDDEEERRAKKGDKFITREVEVDETQPQAKRSYRRGGMGGGGRRGRGRGQWTSQGGGYRPTRPDNDNGGGDDADDASDGPPQSPRGGAAPISPWGMPFNPLFSRPPPPLSQRPMGPQPLLRPTAFANHAPPPPQSPSGSRGGHHPFHQNQPPRLPPSPWAVPPPAVKEQLDRMATPPPPFIQQQQQQSRQGQNAGNWGFGSFGGPHTFGPPQGAAQGGPGGNFGAPSGSFGNPGMFGQPPPTPPPGTNAFASHNMGNGSFGNFGSPPMNFGSLRPDMNRASPSVSPRGEMMPRNPAHMGPFGPVFTNHNNNEPKREWLD